MKPPFVHQYVQNALTASPVVLRALTRHLAAEDPTWDKRPHPDRFSLREIAAHLADWEAIWQERFELALREDAPEMPDTEPGRIAAERDYAHSDPLANVERFAEGRKDLAALIASIEPDAFERTIVRPGLGPLTVDALIVLLVSHDGYHMRQVAEWLGA